MLRVPSVNFVARREIIPIKNNLDNLLFYNDFLYEYNITMKSLFKSCCKSIKTINHFSYKNKVLMVLYFFIILITMVLLFWIYILYFKTTLNEGFSQSLMHNIKNNCDSLVLDLKEQLNDPSNTDLSNNNYYINRLLKKTIVNETVIDLSNQLYDFNNTYCLNNDCSGIPQLLINDISQNIRNIGNILKNMPNNSKAVNSDFSNIEQFYNLSFDCSGKTCK